MDVMERSCYELSGGGKGMRGCLKSHKVRPHSKAVLWDKECIPNDNAMVCTRVGLTFYSAVFRPTVFGPSHPNDQM